VPTPVPPTDWLAALFRSPVYAAQEKASGRMSLERKRVRSILGLLRESGGKLTESALAHHLQVTPVRVGGVIEALRRLLNVDGFQVIDRDAASATVCLDLELLRRQFDIQ
jgi:hypothetical protein